jgi:hypothetical protein
MLRLSHQQKLTYISNHDNVPHLEMTINYKL